MEIEYRAPIFDISQHENIWYSVKNLHSQWLYLSLEDILTHHIVTTFQETSPHAIYT